MPTLCRVIGYSLSLSHILYPFGLKESKDGSLPRVSLEQVCIWTWLHHLHTYEAPFSLEVKHWICRGLRLNFDELRLKEFNLSSHNNTQSFKHALFVKWNKHAINFNKKDQVHFEIINNNEIPLLDSMIIPSWFVQYTNAWDCMNSVTHALNNSTKCKVAMLKVTYQEGNDTKKIYLKSIKYTCKLNNVEVVHWLGALKTITRTFWLSWPSDME